MTVTPAELFVWALLLGAVLAVLAFLFAIFVMLPVAMGAVLLESQGNTDHAGWEAWLAGIAIMLVVLFAVFLLVGFVRFSWLLWGNLTG